jgi:hypothetical protein
MANYTGFSGLKQCCWIKNALRMQNGYADSKMGLLFAKQMALKNDEQ